MNASIQPSDPSILYYDSDYPSKDYFDYPENFDDVVISQGIADDVATYLQLTKQHGKKILELCCGTGRVSIPLVKSGCKVTAVDISAPLLKQFKNKIHSASEFDFQNLTIVKQDVTQLALPNHDFDVIICAFNSLLCIPDFDLQQQVLLHAATHLRSNGILALDIWNPLAVNLWGDEHPAPFFTRRNINNGNVYTRFAATGAMDMNQIQSVYGWYDEIKPDGTTHRKSYRIEWRLIFRYEIQLMLEKAGFKISKISGGNHYEPLTCNSLKMFIEAVKL